VPHEPADESAARSAREGVAAAADRMGRTMPADGLRELMAAATDSPRWDEVAGRCLTCGNCTMVCPTCFCTTVEDVTDLTGAHAERWRTESSCFDLDFSYLHGGSIRTSAKSRYRQWLTHKLGTWHDQFGSSGCVGCGRCIVWCPVGIDLTEEVAALREET
jgi:Fe-S-cluster-containing hydrogenase component 2